VNWRDRVTIHVELGLRATEAGSGEWDTSQWDSGADWSGMEPTWGEVDGCVVESFETDRGRKDGKSRNRTGTASLALVWPAPGPEGRWSFRPSAPLRLGQECRIRATVAGIDDTIDLFRGAVRKIEDDWSPNGPFRVIARLTDRGAELAAVDLPEQALTGLGDLTHDRVLRVLALANIPSERASMGTGPDDSGTVEHASSNFARNLSDEAFATVESDAGTDLFVDRAGLFTMRRRRWWLPPDVGTPHPRWNTTRATWTNVDDTPAYTFSPVSFGTGQDLDDVQNQVTMARSGGTAQTVSDTDSIVRYGLRTHQRMDLTCRYDADVLDVATLRLEELREHTDRVDAVVDVFDPTATASDIARWVDVELGDQHAIEWDDGAGPMFGVFHVQGVRHRAHGVRWELTLNLWAYAGLGLLPVAESTWGTGTWGSATWQAG
jgi:hypothetical protein